MITLAKIIDIILQSPYALRAIYTTLLAVVKVVGFNRSTYFVYNYYSSFLDLKKNFFFCNLVFVLHNIFFRKISLSHLFIYFYIYYFLYFYFIFLRF